MELLFTRNDISMDDKYETLLKKIDNAARASIGKTTIKMRSIERFSQEVKDMRKEKRILTKKLKKERRFNGPKLKYISKTYKSD